MNEMIDLAASVQEDKSNPVRAYPLPYAYAYYDPRKLREVVVLAHELPNDSPINRIPLYRE